MKSCRFSFVFLFIPNFIEEFGDWFVAYHLSRDVASFVTRNQSIIFINKAGQSLKQ